MKIIYKVIHPQFGAWRGYKTLKFSTKAKGYYFTCSLEELQDRIKELIVKYPSWKSTLLACQIIKFELVEIETIKIE